MVIDSQVVGFAVAAALLTVTPGQDTRLIVRNVLRGGPGNGVATTFGVCSGLFMHAVLSAVGMSVVLTQSAAAFDLVKAAGAGYLVWLGLWSIASATVGRQDLADSVPGTGCHVVSSGRCFFEGLLSNALNPKTAIFYLAFLPQFITATDPVLTKSLLLAGFHFGEALVWLVVVSVAVGRMRPVFTSAVRRWLDGACGAMLTALGVRLALERQ